ncbi:MAG: hypothetical protein WA989_07925 [Henriciella sp.]
MVYEWKNAPIGAVAANRKCTLHNKRTGKQVGRIDQIATHKLKLKEVYEIIFPRKVQSRKFSSIQDARDELKFLAETSDA